MSNPTIAGAAVNGSAATIVCTTAGLQENTGLTWDLESGTYESEDSQDSESKAITVTLKITTLTKDMTAKLVITSPDDNTQYVTADAYVQGIIQLYVIRLSLLSSNRYNS